MSPDPLRASEVWGRDQIICRLLPRGPAFVQYSGKALLLLQSDYNCSAKLYIESLGTTHYQPIASGGVDSNARPVRGMSCAVVPVFIRHTVTVPLSSLTLQLSLVKPIVTAGGTKKGRGGGERGEEEGRQGGEGKRGRGQNQQQSKASLLYVVITKFQSLLLSR